MAHISHALVAQGIEAEAFRDSGSFIAAHASNAFAAILIEDSETHIAECLAELRQQLTAQTAIIVIGAGGAARISRALLMGADDYAISCEPMSHHLVQRAIARISVKLRASQSPALKIGAYTLDLANGVLRSHRRNERLTSRELTLTRVLFERCNQLVATEELCQALCGRIDDTAERAVKQHAYELRRKLQRVVPTHGESLRIETVYGKGYRLSW
ncbi:winged helix-turn-helix domain-containing protein [Variovorax sp. Sphag1AA]|uniref:winged helix-turn-helix domain-containing protein n=1 Tax=Variovorax sp. Sphag1AA TaxID=2587027 RepID=UPI00160BAEC0|nr:winged helix-turn-helix domain-containing protein [Variovorax sp. Sphag1AA]MBB3181699.1 DNA-binding response OmpR family regulator [Variovorax sp. Sphag1AA]